MRYSYLRFSNILLLLLSNFSFAQWSSDPAINNVICNAADRQEYSAMCSDGSGGAIIVWEDLRNSGSTNYDIYAQRINSAGNIEWASNGVVICDAPFRQLRPQIVEDGSGGAIITWEDERVGGSNPDVYVQKINSSGITQWTDNGIPVASGNYYQSTIRITGDGAGGAIITWADYRNSNFDIFAYRIESDGTSLWTAGGEVICNQSAYQQEPRICMDGSGGAIITWYDFRDNPTTSRDIYAQKINSAGVVQWTANGVVVCNETQLQEYPEIAPDGIGGAIITWLDYRSSTYAVYAQRLNSSDGISLWTANGVPVTTAAGSQPPYPKIINSGGHIFICWRDVNSTLDIYIHQLNITDGSDYSINWTSNGTVVCNASDTQTDPYMIGDGLTGAIISWTDQRSGGSLNSNIYAQRVFSDASMGWTDNGIAVCSHSNSQTLSCACPNGSNGAIVAWQDLRNGNLDVYSSNVSSNGALPIELISFSAEKIEEGIYLQWQTASEVNNYGFEIQKKVMDSKYEPADLKDQWEKAGFVKGAGNCSSPKKYTFMDYNVLDNCKYSYRLKQIDSDGTTTYSNETEVSGNSIPTGFILRQNYPNPFNPATAIRFTTPVQSKVKLEIINILGEKITTLVDEIKEPGHHKVNWNSNGLAAGIYLCVLHSENKEKHKNYISVIKMLLLK